MSSLRRSLPSQHPVPAPELEAPANDDVHAQFDTPGHIEVGNSVPGEGVEIHGVPFTAGELAALVDYVGNLTTLERDFSAAEVQEMKRLLASGCEDTATWDRVTHGRYSALAFANECHFAPGAGGGPNFRASFVDRFAAAFALAQQAGADEDGDADRMKQARLCMYDAEHYLEDAFSSGHQVSAGDVDAAVDELLARSDLTLLYHPIASDIVARSGDVLSRYSLRGLGSPIDSAEEVLPIVLGARWMKGTEGIQDSARLALHLALEQSGVEVASAAHPTPWRLTGDHHPEENAETMAALGAALGECRDTIEVGAMPGLDPRQVAEALFERHVPTPTGAGRATVDAALTGATGSALGLAKALSDAACDQIDAIMDEAVAAGVVVELEAPAEAVPDRPYVEFPDTRPSYVPGS